MVIGLVEARLRIMDARSLKDKRRVVRSLKDRVLHRMNVSVAEVGDQDLWQTAALAFVTVAAEQTLVQERLAAISAMLQSDPRYTLLALRTALL
ncbi:MAG: DUF503 domain-containing protein [Lentisphaerae bacterium]|nr:DUF503 domain-containing protein [Lentisphaerota bacterium]